MNYVAALLTGMSLLAANAAMAQQAHLGQQPALTAETCPADERNWATAALERATTVHLGLPKMSLPAENLLTEAKIRLGRKLFFDRRLSINGTMSCAMCHVPEQGFANWEMRTAVGVEGRSVKRNAPTLINVGFLNPLFHDGRDVSLETQYVGPLVAYNEMANPSAGLVIANLKKYEDYTKLFDAAFGAPASLDRVGMAIASYQRTLVSGGSAFDRWYFGGEEDAISDGAKHGFDIFTGKGNCVECHLIENEFALFTDQQFHDTGYGQMREDHRQYPPETITVQVAPGVFHEVSYDLVDTVSGVREADLGRYEVTEDPEDRWLFRTPTLRNLTITPPYMHDGFFGELSDVIAFYDRGGAQKEGQDPRIHPLGLSETEMQNLEGFLESLTSPGLECLTGEARVQPPDNK